MKISDIKGCFKLHNGVEMPYMGLGVYLSKDGKEVENAIAAALECGYRHIDTASFYDNEEGVGRAVKKSNVKREDIFITTKLWNADQGYQSTMEAFETSRKKLGTDYVDLYLLHWPVEELFCESWQALEDLYKAGKVRAIGVSNFMQHHLEELLKTTSINPMVNQVEYHPLLQQTDLQTFCKRHQIQYESWAPLMQGRFKNLVGLNDISEKYHKSMPQIILRWCLQNGVISIPKSVTPSRIQENANIFDFSLDDEDMHTINSMDEYQRVGPDPYNFNF